MKPMYEISTAKDIAMYKAKLEGQVRTAERQLRRDVDEVSKGLKRVAGIGSKISNIIGFFTPKVNFFLTGLDISRRLFRRRKK